MSARQLCIGSVFEFEVEGRYYYLQIIRCNDEYNIVRIFFDGVNERPVDMDSYIRNSVFDYYAYYIDKSYLGKILSYVGRYTLESAKWKDEPPPFYIYGWPIDDLRRPEEIQWLRERESSSDWHKLYDEDERRIKEMWIAKESESLPYYPRWKIKLLRPGTINSRSDYQLLPDESLLDYPIYTSNIIDEVRLFTRHGATSKDYFRKRCSEEPADVMETRVVAALKDKADRGYASKEKAESVLALKYYTDQFRTDISSGDVYEICDDGHYYYFQALRKLNFFHRELSKPHYYLIKLAYARYDKRPNDLLDVFNSQPTQDIVSLIRKTDNIEFVGNYKVESEWRDDAPPFLLFFHQNNERFPEPESCMTQWKVIVRGDRLTSGFYFYEEYQTGSCFPSKFRSYPLFCEIYDRQFSFIALREVDYYLARGQFQVDVAAKDSAPERLRAWAENLPWNFEESSYDKLPEFVAYKHTATDLRKRAKKLVGMQRRRKQFTPETIAKFEAILTEFVDNIVDKKDDKKNIQKHAKAAIRKLNRMNDKLDQALIETEERDELFQFFFDAGSYVGVDIGKLIEDAREW